MIIPFTSELLKIDWSTPCESDKHKQKPSPLGLSNLRVMMATVMTTHLVRWNTEVDGIFFFALPKGGI
jgi:hypothetical protein